MVLLPPSKESIKQLTRWWMAECALSHAGSVAPTQREGWRKRASFPLNAALLSFHIHDTLPADKNLFALEMAYMLKN